MKKYIISMLIIAISFAGCKYNNEPTPPEPNPFIGTWHDSTFLSIYDTPMFVTFTETDVTMFAKKHDCGALMPVHYYRGVQYKIISKNELYLEYTVDSWKIIPGTPNNVHTTNFEFISNDTLFIEHFAYGFGPIEDYPNNFRSVYLIRRSEDEK